MREHEPKQEERSLFFLIQFIIFFGVVVVSWTGKHLSVSHGLKKYFYRPLNPWLPERYLCFLPRRLLFHRRHMQDIWDGMWITVSMSGLWIYLCWLMLNAWLTMLNAWLTSSNYCIKFHHYRCHIYCQSIYVYELLIKGEGHSKKRHRQ